jgi:hypothetical protein
MSKPIPNRANGKNDTKKNEERKNTPKIGYSTPVFSIFFINCSVIRVVSSRHTYSTTKSPEPYR